MNPPTEVDNPAAEIARLQERVRRLADEKSHLQLILRLIEQINPLPGVHDMVGNILHNIVEMIGGTDIKIWYWIEDEMHFASFLGERQIVGQIDDSIAAQAARDRKFVELGSRPEDSLLQGHYLPGAWTWAFPLQVGDQLIGVIKLENINIIGASLSSYLPTFFTHTALILSNEIRSHLRQKAQAAQRLAASVFANSQEGIVITDAQNQILDVNAAFTRISGYTRDEVIGRNPKLLGSGRQGADFYAAMWKVIQATGAWHGEIWNRRKSGEVYAEMLSIDAVLDEAGNLLHYVGAFSDISQIKEHQAELERIAHYDALTSLPNRRLLADRLEQELARTRRSGRSLALCYLDLDGFKPVNDQYGHDAGDLLLVEIGRRLQTAARAVDTVARIGGDEFVLLLCDLVQEQECFHALDRILKSVARPVAIDLDQIVVGASIGVTLFPRDDSDADTLMRHADQAMYLAKESGKNRFHIFDAEHDRLIKANRETLQHMEKAFLHDQFVLFYQPKVDMISGKVVGAEALIRWLHPQRGVLSPAEFLPLLSGTNLEVRVDEWVIETALKQLEVWTESCPQLVVSVNVSAHHLLRPNFVAQLKAALQRHPTVSPGQLELEILETTAINDVTNASRTLANCISLGVSFALDDFGTGYSSLTYFRKLPVGTLKIDQSFVRDMIEDPEDFGIIESVIALAKTFNRPVIAEGVETLDHGAMLTIMGCRLAQGYGIARPMPALQLPEWIAQWQGHDIWQTLSKYALPAEDLVLVVAERSLREWFDAIKQFIATPETSLAPHLQPTQCAFGRWFYGSGMSRYGQLGEYNEIEVHHTQIHELATRAHALLSQGQHADAQQLLPELLTIYTLLHTDFRRLVDKVQHLAPSPQENPAPHST